LIQLNKLALSLRAAALGPSPTLEITAKVKKMHAAGEDVISFAAGEPDFNTPEPICEAAIRAIHEGKTKYTPSSGIPELKSAIAAKLARDNQITVQPEQVVVSCGAKQSVYNILQVLVNPGDEVILLAPYWMTYAEQIRLAGGVPVVVHSCAEKGFVPEYDHIRAAVTDNTKAIILNSPTNPSGAILPRSTLKEIAALALRHNFWIVSDEIYEKLIYGAKHTSIGSLGAEVLDRTITVNGCSKTYAMTGWRIGYAAAPKEIAAAMSNLQDQVTSNPTSFAQYGAVVALQMPPDQVEVMRAEFEARRDLIVNLLKAIPGVTLTTPMGAFYVLPKFEGVFGDAIPDDKALAHHLLEKYGVGAIPGSVFEAPEHLRLTYTASKADIERGVQRIAEAVRQIRQ
jgi:aspartate aminotransferase